MARARRAPRARSWPRAIWVLLGGVLLARAAGYAYPFLAYHLGSSRLHLPAGVIGAVLATFGGGWLLGQVLCGWAADRLGRRVTLVGAMTAGAISTAVLAVVESIPALFAAAAVAGACYDAPRPVVSACIADLIHDEAERAAVSGWRHFAVNVGAALGAAGGLLAGVVGTQGLFEINAAACAVIAILTSRYVDVGPPPPPEGAVQRGHYRRALKDARLWLLCLASLMALICVVGLYSALPMLMSARGLSATDYGWTQAVNALVVLLITPAATRWLSHRAAAGPLWGAFAAGSLILGTGMAAAALAEDMLGFAAGVAMAVPGEVVVMVAASDLLNRITPTSVRGLYAGIWGTTLAGAVVLTPLMTGWSFTHGGPTLVAMMTLCSGLTGAALCLPLRTFIRRVPYTAPIIISPSTDELA
ncbi:MFS transporter [Streptomyces lydicus]|uniref:MFS transporter n=1 Tax=Streptomyces lydicus TaxID=47763 RepID=UPI001F5137DC|nr:MFS transporter [Streptomyces lydicus]MCZ1012116.1 MFS transporter [Streptomyces lydicus]